MKDAAWTTWLGASLVLFLGGMLAVLTEQGLQQRQADRVHQQTSARLQQQARWLEQDLNAILALNQVLASEIRIEGKSNPQQLESLAETLVFRYRNIASITMSEGLVVNFIYPLSGNEAVLGMNYRFRLDVMVGVKRALSARNTIVAGPLKLVQNARLGLIGRTPVYLPAENGEGEIFLGLISIAIDLQDSLREAGLLADDLPFEFAIRGQEEQGAEGEPFYGPSELFRQPQLPVVDILLPGGRWQMVARPKESAQISPLTRWGIRILGALLSIGLAGWILYRHWLRSKLYPKVRRPVFSLHAALMLLLLCVLLPVVLGSGYLSYRHALQLAEQYTEQMSMEIGSRIYDRIVTFFDVPRRVLAFNMEQANAGLLQFESRALLMRHFLLQLRQQPLLTFISIGMADGEYYAGSRPPLGADRGLRLIYARREEDYALHIHRVDDASREGSPVFTGTLRFDARTRPWFRSALQAGSMAWYAPYRYVINDVNGAYNALGIGMSAPLYDGQGQLLGVAAADMALSQLSDSLSELMAGTGGVAFICETNGELLATSSTEPTYHLRPGWMLLRILAQDSENPIIQAAGNSMRHHPRQPEGNASLWVGKARYRLDWRTYKLMQGPALTIGVALPEARFTRPMQEVLHNSIALALSVLLLCSLIGIFATGWVAQPLAALSRWAGRLAKGDWTAVAPKTTPVREIALLSASLDAMSEQIRRNTEELELRILQRTADLEQLNQQLAALSTTDGLTGLANRRHFDETLSMEWARARRGGQSLALVMIDVDLFKSYNDQYGHPAGDRCLKAVAKALQSHVKRAGDLAARYGGEEFVVISPNTNFAQAHDLAERLRQAVLELAMPHETSPLGVVSISLGLSVLQPVAGLSEQQLLKAADEALYQAKAAGRNCVH